MKWLTKYRASIVYGLSLLLALLFVYAAVSKLMELENFRLQLMQSPLLENYANELVWVIPLVEIFVALMLLYTATRLLGLIGSLTLMLSFTLYFYIILNFSSSIPCSCAGIINNFTWQQHLVFNIGFTLLAAIGLYLYLKKPQKTQMVEL